MLPGEWVDPASTPTCSECQEKMILRVCASNSYWLGFWCDTDGPYHRATHYFPTLKEAADALEVFKATGSLPMARTP